MTTIKGVQLELKAQTADAASEDRVDAIYSSLIENFLFASVDVACDLEAGIIGFHIGVRVEEMLDSDEFVLEVVDDAIKRAVGDGNESLAERGDARVMAF